MVVFPAKLWYNGAGKGGDIMKIIIIFATIIILKIVTNTFRYFSTKYYYIIFLNYLKNKSTIEICRYTYSIGKLFEKAGTQRNVTVRLNHSIYGTDISTQLNNSDFSKDIAEIFEITLGVYSQRIRESIYPLYWINLPLIVLENHGFMIPKLLKIPVKIIYWFFSVAAAYFLEEILDSYHAAEKIQELLHIL